MTIVSEELGQKRQELWFALAEELMLEGYGEQHLEPCESCDRFTLTRDMGGQGCFAEPLDQVLPDASIERFIGEKQMVR